MHSVRPVPSRMTSNTSSVSESILRIDNEAGQDQRVKEARDSTTGELISACM